MADIILKFVAAIIQIEEKNTHSELRLFNFWHLMKTYFSVEKKTTTTNSNIISAYTMSVASQMVEGWHTLPFVIYFFTNVLTFTILNCSLVITFLLIDKKSLVML